MIVEYSPLNAKDSFTGLTVGNRYEVIGIEGDWYRILNDRNDPVLYNPELFILIDSSEPQFWVTEFSDGQRYSYPRLWFEPGFFEDFHDGLPKVVQLFWETHKKYFAK